MTVNATTSCLTRNLPIEKICDSHCRIELIGPITLSFIPQPRESRQFWYSASQSHDDLPDDVVVVKSTLNSKAAAIALAYCACHLPGTLNPQLFTAITWRGNEHLNADITSDRWAPRATDKRSIERDIISKATLRELAAVIPVEDYGEM
jgi:hypothetical protein